MKSYPDIDNLDQCAVHLLGKQDGALTCYLRFFPENVKYPNAVSFGRIAVPMSARGQGLARAAALEVKNYLNNIDNRAVIIISAQLYLKKFYTELGFKSVGESYDEDGIPHIEMHLNPHE